MKLDQLQQLVAIVEHGSLRAAARRLAVPQPALTRSIRALEKDLGCTLFEREARGMRLTPLGEVFHRRAGAVVQELRRARDELAQRQGEALGTVVVALSIMPHVGMLPRALPAFRRRYPQVRIELIEGLFPEVEERLRNGHIDFYLGAAPRLAPGPGFEVTRLFENRRTVVCRQGHPLGRAKSLKALADADWATTSVDHNAEQDLELLFTQHGLSAPRVVLQARTALSIMVALTRDTLSTIPVREPLPAPAVVLVRRGGLPMTPAAEHLCDVLLREQPRIAPAP